jgi:hypothetical protein
MWTSACTIWPELRGCGFDRAEGTRRESPLISAPRLYRTKRRRYERSKTLRNFWVLWVTTIVLACFSNAVAQASYRVTDLGAEGNDNLGCAMSVNDEGWTEIMAGSLPPGEQDNQFGTLLNGRALIGIDGYKFDLGTLGGQNSWMNWGQINDFAQIVGYSETSVPDPNGEDVCGFGTHLTCRPFLWQFFHMSALQTLGGNNGQASGINLRGQIAGFAENGTVDSTCPPGTINNRIDLGACGKTATQRPNPRLFLRWVAIQTRSHSASTIKAKP